MWQSLKLGTPQKFSETLFSRKPSQGAGFILGLALSESLPILATKPDGAHSPHHLYLSLPGCHLNWMPLEDRAGEGVKYIPRAQ